MTLLERLRYFLIRLKPFGRFQTSCSAIRYKKRVDSGPGIEHPLDGRPEVACALAGVTCWGTEPLGGTTASDGRPLSRGPPRVRHVHQDHGDVGVGGWEGIDKTDRYLMEMDITIATFIPALTAAMNH